MFTDTIHVCGKCCRKLGDAGKALRKSVKAALRNGYGDAVALEKSDCFSLCPKGGQVIAAYAKNQPRRLVILEPGSNAASAVEYLLGKSSGFESLQGGEATSTSFSAEKEAKRLL